MPIKPPSTLPDMTADLTPALPDMTALLKPANVDVQRAVEDTDMFKTPQAPEMGEQPLPVTGPQAAGVPEKTIKERAELQQEKQEGPQDPEGGWEGLMQDPVTYALLNATAPGVGGLYARAVSGAAGAAATPLWASTGVAAQKAAEKIAPNHPWAQAAIANGVMLGAPLLGGHYLRKLAARRRFVQPMEEAEGTAEPIENRAPAIEAEKARISAGQPRTTAYVKPVAGEPATSDVASTQQEGVESGVPKPDEREAQSGAPFPAAPQTPEKVDTLAPLEQAAAAKDPAAFKAALAVESGRAPSADVVEVPVNQIHTDPDRLQYKIGYGKEGAGLALTKAKKFNRALGNVVTLMEDPDKPGGYLIVNGHQRLDLARRSGEQSMRAQILPKGTTFEQARAVGALQNIAEERGTAVDAAKIMREQNWTREQMQAEGIDLTSGLMQNAEGLKNLDDGLFRDVTTGKMRPARGVVIGRELADNKPGQQAIAKALKAYEKKGQTITDKQLEDMIRNEKEWGSLKGTETETDLFGTRTLEKSHAPEAAKLVGYIRDKLQEDKRLFGTAAEKQARLKAGGTDVGVEQARDISEGAGARSAALDARGPNFRDVIAKYAPELAQASEKDKPKILKKAYDEAFDALAKDWGSEKGLASVAPAGEPEAAAAPATAAAAPEQPPAAEAPKPATPAETGILAENDRFRLHQSDATWKESGVPNKTGYTVEDKQTGEYLYQGYNKAEAQKAFKAASKAPKPAEPVEPQNQTSPEYNAALDKVAAATQKFNEAQEAYRTKKIGDNEFLAARKEYDAAEKEFDKAHAQEAERLGDPNKELGEQGPSAEELEKAGQGSMFARAEAAAKKGEDPVDIYAGIPVTQLARRIAPLANQIKESFRETFRPEVISRASEDAYMSVNEKLERVNAEQSWMSEAFHRNLKKAFAPMSMQQQASIVSAYERGDWNAIPQEMRPMFQAMRPISDHLWNEWDKLKTGGQANLQAQASGFIDNYWRHLWKDDPAKVNQAYSSTMRTLKQSGGFQKSRKFMTIEDGIKGGLTPAYDNMADMQQAGLVQQSKWIAGQKILKEGKDQGWVRRFASTAQLPPGWQRIPDPISAILQYSEPAGGMVQRGFYAAPKEWNRIIDRALHPTNLGPLAKGLYHIKNFGAGIKVGASLFHPLLTSTAVMINDAGRSMAAGVEALSRGDFPNALAHFALTIPKGLNVATPFRDRAMGARVLEKMKQGIFSDPDVKMMLEAGFTPGTRVAAEVATESLAGAMHLPPKINADFLKVMEKWVAPLKAGQFVRLMHDEIDKAVAEGRPLTGRALKQMASQTAAHSDWLLGQVGAHRMLMSTFMRDATRLGVNFPGWQIGSLKLAGGAVRGATHLAGRALGLAAGPMDQEAKLALQYAAGLAAMAPILGTIADVATTGKPPTSLGGAYIDAADSMPIYILRDVVSAAGHIAGEGYKEGVGRYLLGKAAWPLITASEIFWANRDPTNWQQITYPSQSMPEKAEAITKAVIKQVLPFSLLTGGEQWQRDIASGDYQSTAGRLAHAAVKATFGVRPPPPALQRTATENFINQNREKIARSAATPEEGARWQAKYEVVSQIRAGRYDAALNTFNSAVKDGVLNRDVDRKSIAQMMKEGPVGSAMQTASLPLVMEFWKNADSNRDTADETVIEKAFIKKMQNGAWQKLSPNEQQALMPARNRMIDAILKRRSEDAAHSTAR